MAYVVQLVLMLCATVFTTGAFADITSAYSKLSFEKTCIWEKAASEEEANMGGAALCKGLDDNYPVYFAEGDLRQFVAFGQVSDDWRHPGGFSQFNSINQTIEWRLDDGKPFATILRWFIDSPKDDGSYDKGQVLVVSTVADPELVLAERRSCPAGYVDARANKNANVLARKIADEVARGFFCGTDNPKFYGKRGPYSGTPNDLAR